MKKTTPIFKYALWGLAIVSGIVGAQVAGTTIRQYEVVVNGILGVIVIYSLCRFLLSLKMKGVDNKIRDLTLFDFPVNILLFVNTFFFV
jgi:hypothetical protein